MGNFPSQQPNIKLEGAFSCNLFPEVSSTSETEIYVTMAKALPEGKLKI